MPPQQSVLLVLLLLLPPLLPTEGTPYGSVRHRTLCRQLGYEDTVIVHITGRSALPNETVQYILDVYPYLHIGMGALHATSLAGLERHPRERLRGLHVSYTHSRSLHKPAQLAQEVASTNRCNL